MYAIVMASGRFLRSESGRDLQFDSIEHARKYLDSFAMRSYREDATRGWRIVPLPTVL